MYVKSEAAVGTDVCVMSWLSSLDLERKASFRFFVATGCFVFFYFHISDKFMILKLTGS